MRARAPGGRLTRALRRRLTRLSRDRRGNVAVMAALLSVPLIGFAGLAVDHWAAASAKADVDAAADAAALAAITRASELLKVAGTSETAALEAGRRAGLDQFLGNVGKIPFASVGAPALTLKKVGLQVDAEVNWSGSTKSMFGALFGVKTFALSGTTASSLTLPSYVKVVMLLDTSASMGIGATEAEQQKLHALTNCSVACHLTGYAPGQTSYAVARANNVVTRVDVLRGAIMEVTRRAEAVRTLSNQFKIGLYTYDVKPREVLSIDSADAIDMAKVRAAADAMTLTTTLGGTKLENASKWLRDNVLSKTKRGDGSTLDTPKLYVMLITDGVETSQSFEPPSDWKTLSYTPYAPTAPEFLIKNGGPWGTGFLQAMNPARCDEMKSVSGVTLLPLQVTYLVPKGSLMDNDPRFPWIQTYLLDSGHVDRSIAACASKPEYAFKGTTPTEISSAVLKMFELTVPLPPRLMK